MKRFSRHTLLVLALVGTGVLGACTEQAPTATQASAAPSFKKASSPTGDYIILGVGDVLPAELEAGVAAAGGTIIRSYPELGVAVAHATEVGFVDRASAIAGVESVTEDRIFQMVDPDMTVVEFDGGEPEVADLATSEAGSIAVNPINDPLYALQWALGAINAPEAWKADYTGLGVRVAIVDGGLWAAHPDLAANVDVLRSRSFVPRNPLDENSPRIPFNEDIGTTWHGTHVAGIVAAADNTVGVVGIAPRATLIGVKVLHGGGGQFSWVMEGIYYAATPLDEDGAGADVINLSLGLTLDREMEDRKAVKELLKAVDRATRYAHKQGVTVIAAAGNDTTDFDAERTLVAVPSQSQHVITIAATGPLGWGTGNTDFGRFASYSNFGKSLVDFAAPGGDGAYRPTSDVCRVNRPPPFSPVLQFCWILDMYMSTIRGTTATGGYAWMAGTSMASPVAAGIAALIIQKAGGHLPPGEVEARMRQGAIDLGPSGTDAKYGQGWLNAWGSLQDTPDPPGKKPKAADDERPTPGRKK